MVKGFYKELAKMLADAGYEQHDGGKHQKWKCEDKPTIILPHNVISRHTANAILKTAGIDRKV